ncbi:unnamed protein product [Vitrella brassicaformis CCMP3155]|uniref:Uncharacterized protein n=1 Tax=Vitrella brassicaformis (strain CCMP3155) TaxID=1169540 RepID=A0A0G4EN55_VITBC|nr:unnamed protein product [Vitrella brassicaformis CCMP3155]|eukprot:CEL98546.1 unnamed protein product [Vitrella brassicaformis CCMP3155]
MPPAVDSEAYESGEGTPPSDANACWLVGLPEDVERQLLASLTAEDCGQFRASSEGVGCQLVNEAYLTHRIDAAIRDKGLTGVFTYQKRCLTVLLLLRQWITSTFNAVSLLVPIAVGGIVLVVLYTPILLCTLVLTRGLVVDLLAPLTPFPRPLSCERIGSFGVAWDGVCDLLWSVARSVVSRLRVALSNGKLFLGSAATFGTWIAWLRSPSGKRFLLQLGVIPPLIIVATRWVVPCNLSSLVCLTIVCHLLWSELVLRLVETREGYLLRLLYVIEEGGRWDRCVSLIHYIRNCRLLPSLPMTITAQDLQRAGSRAVFDTRPPAVRQYSLFSHRIRERFAGLSRVNGQDYLGCPAYGDTLSYVTIDLTDPDPPTERRAYDYSSFTDLIVFLIDAHMRDESSTGTELRLCPHFTHPSDLIIPPPKQYQLTRGVMLHTRGQWSGCRKADERLVDKPMAAILILCGDKAADEFLVRINSSMEICTTEPPVACKRRPDERYPQTAALIRQKVVAA